jgi:lysophospholipid acyltransferase (LPLAT)-like uncharacterized protein
MKLRKLWQDSLRFLGHFFLYYVASILCKSLKIEEVDRNIIDELKAVNKNYVLAFWHGTMLLPWYLHRNQNLVALISKSKDGELLARILRNWNYMVIRGSSSSGGDVALAILVDLAKNESSIAVTPDGPKGPRYNMKPGAVMTAKKAGIPLILMGVGVERKKKLNSWDQFQIPGFFSKAKIIYSDPIYIDRNLGFQETSVIIKKCESRLNELQMIAEKF